MRAHYGNGIARVAVPSTKFAVSFAGVAAMLTMGQRPSGIALAGVLGAVVRGAPELIKMHDEKKALRNAMRS